MTGLCIENLSYSYGRKQALDSAGFDVAPGAFCALLGPNGAGKSTLFALLTRLLVADGGRIGIGGFDLQADRGRALGQIGVVFQQPTLDLDLTVRRNLIYFAALHGIGGRDADRRAMAALERLGMAERAGERARDLNGGHRRRTEIARALVHDPRVLLLDEPTVGLDAASRAAITEHAHALARDAGLTVLWATHLTDEVRPDDRLVILHKGQVLSDGIASDLTGDRPLSEVFLGMTDAAP
ncbi:ABC transporter ATP-binding protein [Pukyongiella litopenaei]|uniref:ATP-binding cassette domain-containing protein n=1 Tax=Pukyongiella litopenaei TaxID=2605946 RepID=A0A2S0MQT7_9RHOB|nr:ABC transporter ATP-binding protein [Pukyongiella litopenaei]AVO38232.1 ATP-binding cassette domain-containing protein [Pukyongiella litopenaei]